MLKTLTFKPGINKEITRSAGEGGWFDCDKVRFGDGYPEKIGGWERTSENTYDGICRSLWSWSSLTGQKLLGVGTHLSFYISFGGAFYDITPVRATATLTDPFETTNALTTVEVTDVAHGAITGDTVIFSDATAVGGLTLDGPYTVTRVDDDNYTVEAASAATSSATGGGTVEAEYLLNVGGEINLPMSGFGSGAWGAGPWGEGESSNVPLRLWSQGNFGEDLIFAPRGGKPCYWDTSVGVDTRGILLETAGGASNVPTKVNFILVSDISRFVFAFGSDDVGSTPFSPMRVRWSDQESAVNWTPAATNQAGSLELSRGSEIITAIQSRQEILVWSDAALYSLQYLGAPDVWGAQILGDKISIVGQNAAVIVGGVSFWMGRKTFYRYDGAVQPLPCMLSRHVFDNFNYDQQQQVVAGTNERYNEVWWFYCSADSTQLDLYVIYNYVQNIWYHGSLGRTAWIESGILDTPVAATYINNLVFHEVGNDDRTTAVAAPIAAHVSSSLLDIDEGDRFMFVRKVIPDVTFVGSDSTAPSVTMSLLPVKEPGSGYNDPLSEGGNSGESVVGSEPGVGVIDTFTKILKIRVRGRQLELKIASTDLGVAWQSGNIRIDVRTSGRRG